MNRLGMLIDISHVSHRVMEQALEISLAPVIFSHSSAYAINAHHRNVQDDILRKLVTVLNLIIKDVSIRVHYLNSVLLFSAK